TSRDIIANSGSIYELKVESQNGCVYADSIEVVKVSNGDVYLGKDSTGCIPDSIPLEVSEYFENVVWNDGSTEHKRWIKDPGTYYTQIRIHDCTIGDTILIGFQENPDVELIGDSLICDKTQSILNVTYPGVNPANWQFDGTSEWKINPPTATVVNQENSKAGINVSDTGNYQISYKRISQFGCIQMDTHSLWFYKTPSSEISYVDTGNRCFEYERKIRYMGKDDKNTRFFWDFGGCLKLDSIDNKEYTVTVGINNPNRFISLITSAYGCTSPISKLPIGLTPTFNFEGAPNQSCDSLNIQFNSEVYIDDSVSYFWEFGDNNTSILQNPKHLYVGASKYDVTLWITNVIDGCKNGFKKDDMIEVFQTPNASFSVKPSIALDKNPEITFNSNFDPSYLHKWYFGDNDSSFMDSPTHWYNQPGEYTSSLIVYNEFGCSDTAYQDIIITPFFEIMPNAFRPDSDIEINRTFKPVGIIEYADHYKLQVFNK
ncbi:MAG: PKD domain-containing protein, partial [Bacteroidales bacterium]|nr:PKD domain-containing protein [Bacteroidales bacterium]